MILNDLQKSEIYLRWSLVILDDSQKLKFIWANSQWFLTILDDLPKLWNLFGVILSDSWWFMESSGIYLEWFLMILSDS